MEKKKIVFVPTIEVDEAEYSEVVSWGYNNLTHENVLILTEQEIMSLQYKSKVLDIINELNDGMLQLYEDDWIFDESVKLGLKKTLSQNFNSITDSRLVDIVKKILTLLDISIETGKGLYFHF